MASLPCLTVEGWDLTLRACSSESRSLHQMAVVEAQVRAEFAKKYPSLAAGRWYRVNQSARELDSDDAHALHLESDGELVEVSVDHIVRRKVGDQEQ
jgi:hypothetical protein